MWEYDSSRATAAHTPGHTRAFPRFRLGLAAILYGIDNEIHHNGQDCVYLRALCIDPPPFWER